MEYGRTAGTGITAPPFPIDRIREMTRLMAKRFRSQPSYFFLTALLTARTAPNRTAAQGQMIQVRSHFMV